MERAAAHAAVERQPRYPKSVNVRAFVIFVLSVAHIR
jgi:hypothetical protein